MGDDAYRQRVREELARNDTAQKIVRIAARWRPNRHDAEDLAQSAIVRVLSSEGARWNPEGEMTFLKHVANVVKNVASIDRRAYDVRHVLVDSKRARDERAADGAPLPDEALDDARERARVAKMQAEVLAELDESDPTAAAVYRAVRADLDPADIKKDHGYSTDVVRFAHDRIRSRWRKVFEREKRAERERLETRRATASNVAPKGAVP